MKRFYSITALAAALFTAALPVRAQEEADEAPATQQAQR